MKTNKFMEIIRETRNSKGITQDELAKLASINVKYLGRIERGESIPSLEKVIAICNALDLNLSIDDFKLN